jgi:hypothetical protein
VTDLYRVEWHFVHVTWTPLLHYKYNNGGFISSGVRHCVIEWVVSDDLKHHGGLSSRVKLFFGAVLLGLLCHWRCSCHSPLKCQDPFTQWHSITSWKTWILSHTIVKISNFTAVTPVLWKIGIRAERQSVLVAGNKPTSIYFITSMMQWNPVAA